MIKRVNAAIIRDDHILMVFHQHNKRSYWTLPGGGVEHGETPEEAIIREVKEETGLDSKIIRGLFDEPFNDGICQCYLMEADKEQKAVLGYDPEEVHMEDKEKMLKDIAWHSIESMKNDSQVSRVIKALS